MKKLNFNHPILHKTILFTFIILITISLSGCSPVSSEDSPNPSSQFDEALKQLIHTAITLYILSIFVSFFDSKTAALLKKIAYLNLASILLIFGLNAWALLYKFTIALEKISKFQIFGN